MLKFAKILFFTIGACYLVGVSSCLASEREMRAARAAIEAQDYLKAFKIFQRLADEGDAEAQYMSAALLNSFKDREDYVSMIVTYLGKAANQGHPAAQDLLADYYEKGKGVPQDNIKAFELYKVAAKSGFIASSCNMTRLFQDIVVSGSLQEVEKLTFTLDELVPFAQRATSKNQKRCPSAENILGDAYRFGIAAKRELKRSIKWYTLAAESGNVLAQTSLGSIFAIGQGVKVDKKRARYWYEKAAEQGEQEAIYNLGVMHEQGTGGFEKNYDEALVLYKKSAKLGNEFALNKIAVFYAENAKTEDDLKQIYILHYILANKPKVFRQTNPKLHAKAKKLIDKYNKLLPEEFTAGPIEIASSCLSTRFKKCNINL